MKNIPAFLIAAPNSGSGKTTIARGLIAALSYRGLNVQPFKAGPDYIDTKYHEWMSGRMSINLDLFMQSEEHTKKLFHSYSQDADVSIVEGMMGMFDGYERSKGSSAELAKLLGLPIVLVVDAKSSAYSVAALISGFVNFDKDIRIAGVIFNRVGSERHYKMLVEVCNDLKIECFGYIPKNENLVQESRYLGLDFSSGEEAEKKVYIERLFTKYIDIDKLIASTQYSIKEERLKFPILPYNHIVIVRDEEAFSFLYNEHIDLLSKGRKLSFIDVKEDIPIPEDTDLLYIPGGYPEKHLVELSQAKVRIRSIKEYIEKGGKTIAECGGMMYLSHGIYTEENKRKTFHNLVDVLPFCISNMAEDRKLSLGYRTIHIKDGTTLKGHEFHYSQILNIENYNIKNIAHIENARNEIVPTQMFRYKNLIAGYTHIYLGETDIETLFK